MVADRRPPDRADLIVRNAKVTTLQDGGSAVADAFAVLGERFAELDRRRAVVFEHPGATPGQPPLPPAAGVAAPLADFPFETTRTAIQLVLNGVLDGYAGLRIILSHAGGFLP